MANTFTKSTKSSLLTADVTSSATTNIVTAGSTATLIILSVLICSKTVMKGTTRSQQQLAGPQGFRCAPLLPVTP